MKIGILCASDSEVAPFIPMIEGMKFSEKAMLKVHEGTIEGVQVAVLFSGVCKVNAAVAAQILIDTYHCDVIINAGTAGGMDLSVGLLDVVVSETAVYHDVAEDILTEFHPWMGSVFFRADEGFLEAARRVAGNFEHRVHFGRMATGEQFITDEGRERINAAYAPLSVDMETAAMAHVCHVNGVPFIAVRSMTDTADHRGVGVFEQNCERASQISAEFVRRMLNEIRKSS